MANFFFDGTASVTAAKADNVVITANPALFTSQAQVGSDVVLTYSNGTTITVQGTTLGASSTNLPGVSLAGGTFATGATVDGLTQGQNGLVFGGTNAIATAPLSGSGAFTANSVHAVFGGNGRADATDGNDSIQIGGKGSFLVYGNAGADIVAQGVINTTNIGDGTVATAGNAFDSTSFVTVFGGKNDLGNDSILLANTANLGAKMAIYGGEGSDSINIFNTGTGANTAIFGGQGAADSTDLADSISFNGGGVVNIFANAGADTVNLGATTAIANGSTVTVHGGIGNDTISIKAIGTAAASNIVVYGDENAAGSANVDTITVGGNAGTTVIYGGTAAADANDNNDVISYSGQGTATIYAAGGDDTVIVNTSGEVLTGSLGTTGTAAATGAAAGAAVNAVSNSTTTIFGGNGSDTIQILNAAGDTRGTITATGGAGVDTFVVGTNQNAATATLQGSGAGVTITDFTVGLDVLRVNNGSTVVTATTAGITNVAAGGSLQQALDAASSATAGTVNAVVFNGDAYVVVSNNTDAGFQTGADLAIKLTGVTDIAGLTAATSVIVV